ncbi:D-glucuronyl C5-epimerase family protein [Candidatus Nitrososphaera evergladensis]|uniref:D-glucuronyl C5-epimerase family protein n=1 Tax=Candidatus Nitrososphaera evergladensis TaxID=1459637 RepID=UPI0011E593E7|nr:D-glucuronyl C5-epimerase family protein [Candidatus Nitrososphaera evergladensis]
MPPTWKIFESITEKLSRRRGLLVIPLAIVVFTVSVPPTLMMKPIAFAEDSVVNVAVASDNNDNSSGKRTGWSDIEYINDVNNITMVDYKNLFGLNIGQVYNPNFVNDADWFLSHFEDHGDYYLVPYNYDWHFYSHISAPWYGCEAQSKAMLVTAKAYNETRDPKYLEFSKKVFNGFNSTILNQDGWLLGVAAENNNAAILNSQLFCVANLMTYYEYTGDEQALTLFKKGVDVLEKNIGNLTADCGTYYSLSKDRFVPHQQHPEYMKMLDRLYSMTGSDTLKNTLDKWQQDYLTCGKEDDGARQEQAG